MSRLRRDGTAEPVSRDHILRRERGQGKKTFSRSADQEQDWQPYPVNPYYSAICGDHTYIHTQEGKQSNKTTARPCGPFAYAETQYSAARVSEMMYGRMRRAR